MNVRALLLLQLMDVHTLPSQQLVMDNLIKNLNYKLKFVPLACATSLFTAFHCLRLTASNISIVHANKTLKHIYSMCSIGASGSVLIAYLYFPKEFL
jgi:hypothetical protein